MAQGLKLCAICKQEIRPEDSQGEFEGKLVHLFPCALGYYPQLGEEGK